MTSQEVLVHNLPRYPTPFIGRADEIGEFRTSLADPSCHLLTLFGLGGSGKTRLATHLASQIVNSFADGAFFVPLASIRNSSILLSTLANAIGLQFYEDVPPKQQLLDYLRDKQMLLVLDSFEHLLSNTNLIQDLLDAATDVKIVVTSREALSLSGERTRYIAGMSYPSSASSDTLKRPPEEYGALALFQNLAQRVQTEFSLSTMTMLTPVVEICQLVEGLPLAIELAASWLRAMSCEDILNEIQRRFDFLESTMKDASPRHRSMRVVFDQSWDLLSDDEKAVFRKLSIFRGGFTREAAEAISGASLPTLASLVDKSLVQRQLSGPYQIHNLLRHYAAEKLAEAGETGSTQNDFCHYYMTFIEQRLTDIKGRRQFAAVKEINANFGHIREAWKYAVERKRDNALRGSLETLVVFFWDRYKGRGFEFDEMLRGALNRYEDERSNPKSLWWLLSARSIDYSAHAASKSVLEACIETAALNQDQKEIAFCLSEFGEVMCRVPDYALAVDYYEQALVHYRALNDRYDMARTLFNIANWKWYLGKHEQVEQAIQESLSLRREIGDRVGEAWSLGLLASGEVLVGHYKEAERIFKDMNAIHRESGNVGAEALGKSWLSLEIYLLQGNLELAYTLAQDVLDIARDDNYLLASGYALITSSVLASLNEDYVKAHHLYLEAIEADTWPDMLEMANWAAALAACGMDDYQMARQHIQSTFKYATTTGSPAWITWCLPVMALIFANDGKPEQALELLSLAYIHPASATGWIAKWPLLSRLQDNLRTKLGESAYRAAWERGKTSNLDTITAVVGKQFGDPVKAQSRPTSPTPEAIDANRALVEPLTDREHEVLWLEDIGLSNPEIAARLNRSEETVKKHITNLYSKLGVKTRAEALARGHELGLL